MLVTKYDITWYIKWSTSIIMLAGIAVRATGIVQLQWIDVVCSWIGALGWLYVGYRWNDRAMMLVNGVITLILTAGIGRIILS